MLTGRTALVTGGARRLGRLLALGLGRAGVRVVVHYHTSRAEAEQTAGEIGDAEVVDGDLAVPDVAAALPARAAALCGRPLDILINNAAVLVRKTADETTAAQWDHIQAVNLRAPFLLAREFARQLPAAPGMRADIINLNDARALHGDAAHFAYGVAKAGLHALTQNLARELAPGIAVNELALGAVLAPPGDGYLKTRRTELPSGRFPCPDEVVVAALDLLTTGGTGQTIWLDGGQFSGATDT